MADCTEKTLVALDLLPMLLMLVRADTIVFRLILSWQLDALQNSKLGASSCPERSRTLPFFWRATVAVISLCCPPNGRASTSFAKGDTKLRSALTSSPAAMVAGRLRCLLDQCEGSFDAAIQHAALTRVPVALDWLPSLLTDTSISLPWLSASASTSSAAFTATANLLQEYMHAVVLTSQPSASAPPSDSASFFPSESTTRGAASTIKLLLHCIDACLRVLDHAIEVDSTVDVTAWWSLLATAIHQYSNAVRDPASLSHLASRFLNMFSTHGKAALQSCRQAGQHTDEFMLLPTSAWVSNVLDNLIRLLVVPSTSQTAAAVDVRSSFILDTFDSAVVVMTSMLKWLEASFGGALAHVEAGSVPVFQDIDSIVLLLTFASYFEAAVEKRLGSSPQTAWVLRSPWLRADIQAMYEACFTIRNRSLLGSGSVSDASDDDAVVESLRTLFRLVLKLNPTASIALLEALLRLYAGGPADSGRRRSIPAMSPTHDAVPANVVSFSNDPVCAAYASCATAMILHQSWRQSLLAPAGNALQRVQDLHTLVEACCRTVEAASAISESALIDAIASCGRSMSALVSSSGPLFAEVAASAKAQVDFLATACSDAIQQLKGVDVLTPSYYAVYFVGPQFSEVRLLGVADIATCRSRVFLVLAP